MTASKGGRPASSTVQSGAIGDVHPDELEVLLPEQGLEPVLLEARVVGVVQVVDTDHAVPLGEEKLGDLARYEAGRPGQEHVHRWTSRLSGGRPLYIGLARGYAQALGGSFGL